MAQWGGTKEAVRGTTRRPWVWERRTRTILTLVGVAGLGLTMRSITGGAPLSDARAALAALIVYVTLCALITRVDRARKRQEWAARAEGEERRRRPRRPYSVVDEAEAVLDRVHGQGTR